MRVLVACEFSGRVREAFKAKGHDAWSCDLLPTEQPGQHIQGDLVPVLAQPWDLIIAHPPCTHLAVSGARWWKDKDPQLQKDALAFVALIAGNACPRIAIENPIGALSTAWCRPDQIIQPWQFGHGETKATCLWLKGLPLLTPTQIVSGREPKIHHAPPGPDRWKIRSLTYLGIAQAMADQWG